MYNLVSDTININKNEEAKTLRKNQKKDNKSGTMTNFLHIKKIESIEIKNPKLKCLLDECTRLGPYYSKCKSCNNKNLNFYKDMKYENAEKLLKYIKNQGTQSIK